MLKGISDVDLHTLLEDHLKIILLFEIDILLVSESYHYLRPMNAHIPDVLMTAQFILMGPSIESLIVLAYARDMLE